MSSLTAGSGIALALTDVTKLASRCSLAINGKHQLYRPQGELLSLWLKVLQTLRRHILQKLHFYFKHVSIIPVLTQVLHALVDPGAALVLHCTGCQPLRHDGCMDGDGVLDPAQELLSAASAVLNLWPSGPGSARDDVSLHFAHVVVPLNHTMAAVVDTTVVSVNPTSAVQTAAQGLAAAASACMVMQQHGTPSRCSTAVCDMIQFLQDLGRFRAT